VSVAYLLLYLYSLQHLLVLPAPALRTGAPLAVEVAGDWPSNVWKAVAPFSYEPIAAIYIGHHLAVFLAVPNLLLGLGLGGLVGLNAAVAAAAFAKRRTCRRPGVGLLGTLPGLLTGFTCCVPTVALALGLNSVLALVTLRTYFIPASVLVLAGGLLWGAGRLDLEPAAAGSMPQPGS